jgi:HK97 family phage major capsid protein
MSARLKKLQEKRLRIVEASRAIMAVAEREDRGLTTEEQANFDRAIAEQESLRQDIEREERQARLEAEMVGTRGTQLGGNEDEEQRGGRPNGRESAVRSIGEGRYAVVANGRNASDRALIEERSSVEYNDRFTREYRAALDAQSTGANGSYLITPMQVAQQLLQRLDDAVFIRGRATVFTLPSATSLGRVSLETDAEDADWTTELATGGQEDSIAFGRRELTPHPLAKYAKISNKLLRIATIDPMAVLMQRVAYKFGITEEKAFLTGDGNQKPLGVFTASNDGIPTSRDVSTGNTSTSPTFEGLISAKYSLKAGYLANAAWMFHRDAMAKIAKLREDSGAGAGTGGFLWQPSTQLGQPDRILGLPTVMNENVPNTFSTGQYVGVLGDFSFYHIADALDNQVQRLNELFALTNQTGIVWRRETDGMPVLGEAFVRVKLG